MRVLFVCTYNEGRSQIAEAIFNQASIINYSTSAATLGRNEGKILKSVNPRAVKFMADLGYKIGECRIKQVTPSMVEEADKIMVMAERETWPYYLETSGKVIFWSVPDFRSTDNQQADDTRYKMLVDNIKSLVFQTVTELEGRKTTST